MKFSIKKYYNRIKQNYQLLENFFSLSILNVISLLLPFITLPYLVRVFGVEKYGTVIFILTIMQYITLLNAYGFAFSGVKQISIHSNDSRKTSEIFCSILSIKLLITMICFFLLFIVCLFLKISEAQITLMLFGCGIVITEIFMPLWFFQGMQQMRFITIISIISKTIFTLLTFIIIRNKEDFIYVPLLTAIGNSIAAVVSIILLIRRYNVKFLIPTLISIKYQLKEGFHIFISTMGMNLYRNGNIIILGLLTNDSIVGIYGAAEKLIKAIQSVISPVSDTLYPYFSKRFFNNSLRNNINSLFKLGKYYAAILFIMSITILIFSKWITIIVLGSGFIKSINNLRILSFVVFFGGLNYFFGIIGLINLNFNKQFNKFVMLSGIISIVICASLSPIFFDKAASAAMLLCEIILFVCIFKFLHKVQKNITEIA